MERMLPQNYDAERSVLGSILIDPECLGEVRAILDAPDFNIPAHRDIYAVMDALWTTRTPSDLITVCDELQRRGTLEGVGGASYVSSLANQVPTSANAVYYAEIVARMAVARRVIHAAGQIAGVAWDDPQSDELARDALALLSSALSRRSMSDSVTFADAAQTFLDEQLAVMQAGDTPSGVRYGLDGLDRMLLGIKPGELIYLCGRPGAGKSALAAHVATQVARTYAARDHGTVEYLTFEMRDAEVVARLVAAQAGVNTHTLRANFRRRDGSVDELAWSAACDATVALQMEIGARLRFTTRRHRLTDIRLHIERAVAQRDCQFVVIDYLGLIAPDDDRAARQSEYQRVTNLSRELKLLAQDMQVPILCLVQMSRASENRANPRPVMSDLRDSGGLEQDANGVIGLVRMATYLPRLAAAQSQFAQFAEAHILKARDGAESGAVVPLRFEAPYARFSDWPHEWPYGEYLRLTPGDDGQAPAAGSATDGESEAWQ